MKRAAAEDESGAGDPYALRAVAVAGPIGEGDAAVDRDGLISSERAAVPHEEVGLHPGVSTRRYRDRRRVPTDPRSKSYLD
jgi:hypothetical protein